MYKVYLAALVFASLLVAACTTPQSQAPTPSETVAPPTPASAPAPSMTSTASVPAPSATPVPEGTSETAEAAACEGVTVIPRDSPEAEEIVRTVLEGMDVAALDPRPERMAVVHWIATADGWVLLPAQAEGSFEGGMYAVRESGDGYEYVGVADSGATMLGSDERRANILRAIPDISPRLVRCIDPNSISAPMTRECNPVTLIDVYSAEAEAITAALVRDLPGVSGQPGPTGMNEIHWIAQEGEWVLLSGSTNARGMEPAIFALREEADDYRFVHVAWGGMGNSDAAVRAGLAETVPELPTLLVQCVDVSWWVQ